MGLTKLKTPKILFSEEAVKKRVSEMARQINQDYQGKEVIALCILKGGVIFFADIIRQLSIPFRCEFLGASSYGDDKRTSGEVKLTLDAKEPLENKHLIVFEDIVDSGLTLCYILNLLKARNPATIKLCTFLFKPMSLKARDLRLDYVGFETGDGFVVGYGLDYAGHYRGLPYVGTLE